jgi:hypothetical protein
MFSLHPAAPYGSFSSEEIDATKTRSQEDRRRAAFGSSAAHRSSSLAVCQPTISSYMVIDDPEEPAPALALGAEARGVDRRA